MYTSVANLIGSNTFKFIFKPFLFCSGLVLFLFLLTREFSYHSSNPKSFVSSKKDFSAVVNKMYAATNFNKKNTSPSSLAVQPDTAQLRQSDWFKNVKKDILSRMYNVVANPGSKSFTSINQSQNLKASYDANQFSVQPLKAIDKKKKAVNDWHLNIVVDGLYADGKLMADPKSGNAGTNSNENNIDYQFGNSYTIQYHNDEKGIRQNFVVNEKPAANVNELKVKMHAEGNWVVDKVFDKEIHFAKAHGRQSLDNKIVYNGLKAWDANGKELEAKMKLGNNENFEIVADVSNAVFPVTIDPLTSSASNPLSGSNQFGWSVASAGDVNGDGYSDVIVGDATGNVYIYEGSASGLSSTATTTLTGANYFGTSVACAGDVNGDSVSDVIIGDAEGHAYIFHGVKGTGIASGNSSTANTTISGLDATGGGGSVATAGDVNGDGYSDVVVASGLATLNAIVYYGSSTGIQTTGSTTLHESPGLFGFSVSSAGDVNGDGYSDVIVGDENGNAYLFLGTNSGISSTANITLTESGSFGKSVSSAGDVNGDGYSDVIVGDGSGNAYVFYGNQNSPLAASPVHLTIAGSTKFGTSVAGAGDVNGDAFGDVIIGADNGYAYVFLGTASGISSVAADTLSSPTNGNNYGISVASAGDFNGDGYSDLIVGSSNETKAFTYMGSPVGSSNLNNWNVVGVDNYDRVGLSINSAGDINGDGYSDVIVGANGYLANAATGAAYIYLGSATGLSTTYSAMLSIPYTGNEENFGWSVASAGDVNGDGYGDIVIGAKYSSLTTTQGGAAYIYLGSKNGIATDLTGSSAATIITGGYVYGYLGCSVASAGDVNGDGYGDLIIGESTGGIGGTSGLGQQGAAYIYMGSASGIVPFTADTLYGPGYQYANFGITVAGAGDVNGDGYSDVIVGTYQNENAYVFKGSSTGIANNQPADYVLNDPSTHNFGISVSSAGDVNGDGYSDVIIGASNYDSIPGFVGTAEIFYGSSGGLSNGSKTVLVDTYSYGQLGDCVASAGDVNGDGYSDVIVRATLDSSSSGIKTGAAYVYLGGPNGISTTPASSFYDEGADTYLETHTVQAGNPIPFHKSVASAGDINGDGYSDVLLGVFEDATNGPKSGKAYAYYGNNNLSNNASNLLRLYETDTTHPIAADNVHQLTFGLGLLAQSPFGTVKGKLVWEVAGNGARFSGNPITNSVNISGAQETYSTILPGGTQFKAVPTKVFSGVLTKVRARIQYAHTSVTFGQVYSPWIYSQVYSNSGMAIPLPMNLLKFTAAVSGQNILVSWKTADEENMKQYDVLHSLDGINFDSIGTVAAKNIQSGSDYSFLHLNPGTGTHYYRLREVNLDGKAPLSNIVWATINGNVQLNIYPNPTSNYIVISTTGINATYARIVNASGAIMGTYRLDASGQTTITLSGYAKGNYFVQLIGSGFAPQEISVQ